MKRRILALLMVLALGLAAAGSASGAPSRTAPVAAAKGSDARYALAGGCYALRSHSGRYVVKAGDGYRASAAGVGDAEPFRMQATELGRYLFYGRFRDFLAGTSGNGVEVGSRPSEFANWRVDVVSGGFRISLPSRGKVLAASGGGNLTLAEASSAGDAASFDFRKAQGCPAFPEIETNAVGTPKRGLASFGEVTGTIDAHMHLMAFEFLGGRAHCGRPWHPYGVEYALVDCPDHYPGNGAGAVLENALFGNPARTHDPVGWPTFRDWPHPHSLTHEQTYYKWLERAWKGGVRVFVNLFVENRILCEIYPYKQNSCDEMTSVRLQNKRIRELEDYIDAQNGGPGKGWFRIVTDPFEARRVINKGKVAVVLGLEVSEPFGCQIYNEQPRCDRARIDRELDEIYGFGVRQAEIINKFDNALAGVAGDSGVQGPVVNQGNKLATGKYWDMRKCTGPEGEEDKEQPTAFGHQHDDIFTGVLQAFGPVGAAPAYGPGPHCNARGLTTLGDHAIQRMIRKGMIVDPDHLSVLARKHVMALVEGSDHSGVVSSHSWSTPDVYSRIYNLGGFITPGGGTESTDFVKEWRIHKSQRNKSRRNRRYYFGFGFGGDQNGFATQADPRQGPNPVTYPFKSIDGSVTLHRQRSGSRVFDINKDGVAHEGLYPDYFEDVRKVGGNQVIRDIARGAEAYLEMWERAVGVPYEECRLAPAGFTRRGLGRIELRATPERVLRRAGQPRSRPGRTWSWCVKGRKNRRRKAKAVAVFTQGGRVALVGSNGRWHKAGGLKRGSRLRSVRRRARRVGKGLYVRRAGRRARFVYRVRKGRVRYLAIVTRSVAKKRSRLRGYLRRSGLR